MLFLMRLFFLLGFILYCPLIVQISNWTFQVVIDFVLDTAAQPISGNEGFGNTCVSLRFNQGPTCFSSICLHFVKKNSTRAGLL